MARSNRPFIVDEFQLLLNRIMMIRDLLTWFKRFVLGRPLDGSRKSDATFFRAGSQSYTGRAAYNNRREFWAGWQVLLWRLGLLVWFLLVVPALVWVLAFHAGAVDAALTWVKRLSILAVIAAPFYVARVVRRHRLHEQVIRPTALAVAPFLGYDESLPIRQWLEVPAHLVSVPPSSPRAWVEERLPEWMADLEAAAAVVLSSARSGDSSATSSPVEGVIVPSDQGPQEVTAGTSAPSVLAVARGRAARGVLWVTHTWAGVRESWDGLTAPVRTVVRARHAVVRVAIPHALGSVPEGTRKEMLGALTAKLGGSWEPDWRLRGKHAALMLKPRPVPPTSVKFRDFVERMALAKDSELALGLAAGDKTVLINLDSDSPHVLLSMGSGAGKSVLIRLMGAQASAKGWVFILLDFKQDHYWVQDLVDAGVPGIAYFRKIEEIHEVLLILNEIRAYRSDLDFEARGKMPMQRVLIGFEEMNATVSMLRTYWTTIKQKGDPGKSPALTAFGILSNAARSANMHLIGVGQYMTAQVFGGPEARESFGARIMARYTAAAWRTLVPEYGAPPPRSATRGRVQVCTSGDSPTETQVAFLTHEEAIRYAKQGLAGVVDGGTLPFSWSTGQGTQVPEVLEGKTGTIPLSAPNLSMLTGHGEVTGEAGAATAIESGRELPEWARLGLPEGVSSPIAVRSTEAGRDPKVTTESDENRGSGNAGQGSGSASVPAGAVDWKDWFDQAGQPRLRVVREGETGPTRPDVLSGPHRTQGTDSGSGQRRVADMSAAPDDSRAPDADLRTLAEWCRSDITEVKPSAAEKRRQRERRAGTCTLPADRNVYTESEVLAWLTGAPAEGPGKGVGGAR